MTSLPDLNLSTSSCRLPNASDHLPAGAAAETIYWLHIFGGAGQVYCVVRNSDEGPPKVQLEGIQNGS